MQKRTEKCPLVVDAEAEFQAGRRDGEAKDLHNYTVVIYDDRPEV
jgi:hypothetical protein